MSLLITNSRDALPMETLPALKITHFNGEPARGQVYAYLRCYVRDGEIPFSVTVSVSYTHLDVYKRQRYGPRV